MDFFKKVKEDSVSSPEKMTETLKSFCSKPWEEVSDQKSQLWNWSCTRNAMEGVNLRVTL